MVLESKSSNIKALMQQHGLTIESLSHELDISVSTINRLLVGSKVDPRLSTIRALAKFFSVSIEELMGDRPLIAKASDDDELPNNQALMQIPVIHWEQIAKHKSLVPTLDFQLWDN